MKNKTIDMNKHFLDTRAAEYLQSTEFAIQDIEMKIKLLKNFLHSMASEDDWNSEPEYLEKQLAFYEGEKEKAMKQLQSIIDQVNPVAS